MHAREGPAVEAAAFHGVDVVEEVGDPDLGVAAVLGVEGRLDQQLGPRWRPAPADVERPTAQGDDVAAVERDDAVVRVSSSHRALRSPRRPRPGRPYTDGVSSSTDAAPGRERLVDQAYRQIRDAIVAVRLQPGSPLDEKALSASLGLGLTPIRDALKRLTLEKLAITYPHRGTFVSRINIADEARLTEIRVELEGLAAALAAERATAEDQAVLLQLLGIWSAAATSAPRTPSSTPASTGRSTRPPATSTSRPPSTSTPTSPCASGTSACTEQLAAEEHIRSQRAVVEAIVRRDPAAARSAAEQHLRGFAQEVRSTVLASRA